MSVKSILVVDDNDLNRRLVKMTLSKLGYDIIEAENGVMALEVIGERHIDLVLLDVSMPEMDGIEVLTRLRLNYSMLELPVIMFTADDKQERIVEALSLGANDYLLKPLNQAIAAARIKTQLSIACLSRLKDNVVRFASHDLKKPMLVMADIIESLRASPPRQNGEAGAIEEELALLDQTNRRMQEVVHGFLDQNQFQVSQSSLDERLDLNTLIHDTREANDLYAGKKQTLLNTELASHLPPVNAESFKIRQVLDNMIGNAIKFSPPGSHVVIRSQLQGDSVQVEVVDDGPGLTPADQAQLFISGVQLSNKPTGGESSSGIGLSLCKELIEATGGRIGARTNPDRGATFWFSLPVFDKAAALQLGSSSCTD
ncbi:MAG: hybrid sensor histidine kinase/response regulator [Gammaproteobacteria bacterium]